MKKFKHIFFDLDRTLWDFEANSEDELLEMVRDFKLSNRGVSLPVEFVKVYKKCNELCWEHYLLGKLSQTELRYKRFLDALSYFGIQDQLLAEEMGARYVARSPYRTKLIEYTIETLTYLKNQGYVLHIITNGFEEVQHIKLKEAKLELFFTTITTSEMAQSKKPDYKIFEFALEQAGATKENSAYVGDDLMVDIEGANNVGIASVYFNPNAKNHQIPTFIEITSLKELQLYF